MRWKKLGRIFTPEPFHPNAVSHASNPVALWLSGNVFRVFYSPRNSDNKSSLAFFDYDIHSKSLIGKCSSTLFDFGQAGSFYSHGVSIGCYYQVGDEDFILFMGWQIPEGGHWRGDIGRLGFTNDKFILNPKKPFIEIDDEDPISLSYPWILKENGIYHMWYGSTVTWKSKNGEMVHLIKHAISTDGVNWQKKGLAIPYIMGKYQAFSRPTVLKDQKGYHMWFSYRGTLETKYRIGYAFSHDLENWTVNNELSGITVSDDGWDCEMVCYPCVFQHKGKSYMMFNGNDYGKSGIGLAILEDA